jgi:hypothetical protein
MGFDYELNNCSDAPLLRADYAAHSIVEFLVVYSCRFRETGTENESKSQGSADRGDIERLRTRRAQQSVR